MPANHLDLFAGMLTGQLLGASASPSARSYKLAGVIIRGQAAWVAFRS